MYTFLEGFHLRQRNVTFILQQLKKKIRQFLSLSATETTRDSSVGVVTCFVLGERGLIPDWNRNAPHCHSGSNSSGPYQIAHKIWVSFPGLNRPEHEANQSQSVQRLGEYCVECYFHFSVHSLGFLLTFGNKRTGKIVSLSHLYDV